MNELRRNIIISSQIGGGGPVIDIDSYLTIVALEDGLTAALSGNTIEYCVDGDGDWKSLKSNVVSTSINQGQTLSFRGNLTPTSSGIGRFTISKSCDLSGNCNSLLFGDDAVNNNSLSGKDYAFKYLFDNCTTIRNISSNFLPATTLAYGCYSSMFQRCTSLTTAPELPATTLIDFCYHYMFYGCTSLTTAPQLPATTLANYCYEYMFQNCTSLTTAPSVLPAMTLATYCYDSMFQNCTSLTTAPALPATTLAQYCYTGMFQRCTSLTTAPELPATTLIDFCYNSMFKYCSSLTTAPSVLPATTLTLNCYNGMFYGCSKLTTAPQLPATTLANYCYQYMFYQCTSLTTAPELTATTLKSGCYSYMFYGCSKLNYIKAMFTTKPTSTYTNSWVLGVSDKGTFVKNKNATWDVTGYNGVPSGWTVQTA